MAMLRDTVARTVIDPTPEDIAAIRRQAVDSLISMGAAPDSIEVQMEIDQQKNIVQATATGSLQMEQQDLGLGRGHPGGAGAQIACETFCGSEPGQVDAGRADRGAMYTSSAVRTVSRLFGLCSAGKSTISACWTAAGWSKLQVNDGQLLRTSAGRFACRPGRLPAGRLQLQRRRADSYQRCLSCTAAASRTCPPSWSTTRSCSWPGFGTGGGRPRYAGLRPGPPAQEERAAAWRYTQICIIQPIRWIGGTYHGIKFRQMLKEEPLPAGDEPAPQRPRPGCVPHGRTGRTW